MGFWGCSVRGGVLGAGKVTPQGKSSSVCLPTLSLCLSISVSLFPSSLPLSLPHGPSLPKCRAPPPHRQQRSQRQWKRVRGLEWGGGGEQRPGSSALGRRGAATAPIAWAAVDARAASLAHAGAWPLSGRGVVQNTLQEGPQITPWRRAERASTAEDEYGALQQSNYNTLLFYEQCALLYSLKWIYCLFN